MGCDIHQINILIDAKTKKPYCIDGEIPNGQETDYHSDNVQEFIDGRNYKLFGILAGVRGDDFQINGNVYPGIPEELPEDMKKEITDPDYCNHSFTWFYMQDLLKELEWTQKKIGMFIKASSFSDPYFIAGGEIDEYYWLKESVKEWIKILKETRKGLSIKGREEDFKTSKIFFFFDC